MSNYVGVTSNLSERCLHELNIALTAAIPAGFIICRILICQNLVKFYWVLPRPFWSEGKTIACKGIQTEKWHWKTIKQQNFLEVKSFGNCDFISYFYTTPKLSTDSKRLKQIGITIVPIKIKTFTNDGCKNLSSFTRKKDENLKHLFNNVKTNSCTHPLHQYLSKSQFCFYM